MSLDTPLLFDAISCNLLLDSKLPSSRYSSVLSLPETDTAASAGETFDRRSEPDVPTLNDTPA